MSKYFCGASMAALALTASTAFAQSPTSQQKETAVEDGAEGMLSEVVVTAQKRQESMNDVPMSITAVTGDALARAGVTDVGDLARVTPGYTFTKTHDAVPVLTIRGVGYYDNNIAATPAVSAYVDETPLPYSVMTAGALLDLDRVEVLKGPQGTLFGQNSTGGALNFVAAKPLDYFEGRASLGYGRFNAVEATGYIMGPLSDTVSARLSGRIERSDDWQRSYTRDDSLGRVNRNAGRLLIDWTPNDRLKTSLTLETWTDKSDAQAAQVVGLALQIPGLQNPALATGDGSPGDPIAQVYPNAPHNSRAADWTPGVDYRADNRYYRASLRTEYELTDTVNLTSITSYQDLDYKTRIDGDGTALVIAEYPTDGGIKAFYQELRLSGDTDHLTWLIGGNYGRDRVRASNNPRFDDWSVPIGSNHIITNENVETVAVFANAEYKLGGGFSLQGGARYTDHKQRMVGCPADSGDGRAADLLNFFRGTTNLQPGACYSLNDLDGSFAPGLANMKLHEDNVSWRVGLNYKPNSDLLVYGNISKGYKAGAFTLATADLFSQLEPATQESILAYEAGFKVGGPTFQINGAAFYYDYRDKQLLAPFDTLSPFGILDKLQNIPKSRIYGAELQTTWVPIVGLQLGLNGTFVDSKVISNFIATSPFGGPLNLKGERFPYTPRWQFTGDAAYRFALGDDVQAMVGASISYRSDTSGRFGGGELYKLESYALLDLRAGVEFSDGKYALDLWGRNVTNKYYRVNVTTAADTVIAYTGQPATYGVRGAVRF